MGNGIHQAAEDLERIEPVLSLEGRLESSPRQGKKPWVVGEETHDALRHTGMNKRKQCYDSACSFFSPKNKRNKQKEGWAFKNKKTPVILFFGCGLTFWSSEVLNLFFFDIYKPFTPSKVDTKCEVRTFYRAVTHGVGRWVQPTTEKSEKGWKGKAWGWVSGTSQIHFFKKDI